MKYFIRRNMITRTTRNTFTKNYSFPLAALHTDANRFHDFWLSHLLSSWKKNFYNRSSSNQTYKKSSLLILSSIVYFNRIIVRNLWLSFIKIQGNSSKPWMFRELWSAPSTQRGSASAAGASSLPLPQRAARLPVCSLPLLHRALL